MYRFFRYITRHAVPILASILCLTVFLAMQLPKLHVDTSVMRMLVEDLPAKYQYDQYREEFGGVSDDIVVVLKAEDVFSRQTFEEISGLTESLTNVEGVKDVVSLSSLKNDLDILNEWSLQDLRKNLGSADVFIKNLISADGKATALVVILQQDYQMANTIQAIEEVLDQSRKSDDPLQIYQIGSPVVGHTLTQYTLKDFRTLPLLTMLIIFLVLLFCLRTLLGALVPFAAVCLTLVWTFGLMGLMGISLSMVTMIIPTLLIAVGSAYALHIMAAYFDETGKRATHEEAIVSGLARICLPTIVASGTTIVGFASLLFNRIVVIREFAVFSCLGLLLMLIIHLAFIPAILSRFKMPKTTRVFDPLAKSWIETFLQKITSITKAYPKTILILYALVALVAGAGLLRIRAETAPISYFKGEAPVKMAFDDIHKHLAGIYPINVVLRSGMPDYFSSPENLRKVEALQGFISDIKGVDVTVSVVDLLKFEGLFSRSFRNKEEYYALPDDPFIIRQAIQNYRKMGGGEFIDHFLSRDFSRVNVTCRSHMTSTLEFINAEKVILAYVRDHFPRDVDIDVTGLTMAVSHSSTTVTMGQVKSLGLALGCIFVLLSILFLSPKVGFYAMLPNFFPILVNFGIMGWLGIHLSVATSLIASIAIGLSVDDTIHYMFRFNQELKKDLSRRHAMARTTAAVGRPVVFTSLTIGFGFSVLMFSSFVPTIIFGFLMLITVGSALIGDLFILAAILLKIQLVTLWDLLKLKLGSDPREGIPLFDGLSRSQVHYILMAGALRKCERGDVLFRKGEISESMYAVISGSLKVMGESEPDRRGTHGTSKLIATLGKGALVGEMGMVRKSQRSATVVAKTGAELLEINDKMIQRLQWLFSPTAQKFFFNLVTILSDRLEETTRDLSELRTVDGVTGLQDRIYFEDALDREILRAQRYETPFAILLIEVKLPGKMIALSSMEARDLVLFHTARVLEKHMRKSDTVCRFDQDQFAVLLPNSFPEHARQTGQRLRELVQKHPFKFDDADHPLTVNIGFAIPDPDLSEGTLEVLSKASLALNRAKGQGGNRIEGET